MTEATVTFDREGREGIVPVGTYLRDAAERLGVRFESKCQPSENIHFCLIEITSGGEHLSPQTDAEKAAFEKEPAGPNARLACQVKIVNAGDIHIMTTETKEETAAADAKEEREYAKEFAELPLEKKFAELARLEAIALGETFSFIFNSPYLVFDKVVDVMAGFGMKKEENGRKAARPAEHIEPEEARSDDGPEQAAQKD